MNKWYRFVRVYFKICVEKKTDIMVLNTTYFSLILVL
jgi:hypothetical protein